MRNQLVAVIGAGSCDSPVYQTARKLGQLLAEGDYTIICGGLGGVMEAACRGAMEKNGLTIGILPGEVANEANPYINIVIPSGMGIGRNLLIVRSAIAVIAISGGYGTLSEIAFALQLEKPVIGLGTWQVSDKIIQVESPEEALARLNEQIG